MCGPSRQVVSHGSGSQDRFPCTGSTILQVWQNASLSQTVLQRPEVGGDSRCSCRWTAASHSTGSTVCFPWALRKIKGGFFSLYFMTNLASGLLHAPSPSPPPSPPTVPLHAHVVELLASVLPLLSNSSYGSSS